MSTIASLIAICLITSCAAKCVPELTFQNVWTDQLQDYTSSDFNVISFNNFYTNRSGDIEGRVLALNNITFGVGFSVGFDLFTSGPNATDSPRQWSLIAGGNVVWPSGALYPAGNNDPFPAAEEGMFVGGQIDAPSYLSSRVTGGPCDGCIGESMSAAYAYFTNVSAIFASATPNAQASYANSGIFLTSDNIFANRYYLQIPASLFNKATYWSTTNMNIAADFIVTITGDDDVIFSGGNFPSIVTQTVFNIPGNRNVVVYNDATGHILAPDATLKQYGGDEMGMVIVGDVQAFVEAMKPSCPPEYCCKWCTHDTMEL